MKRVLYKVILVVLTLHHLTLKANDVLPGDCDKNGKVELVDFLFWGLAAGNKGNPRANPSTDCTTENAKDWNVTINGINGKHQDADGNGIVDKNDLNIITGNYGCQQGSLNTPTLNRNDAIFSIVEQTTIIDGNTAHIFEIYVTQVEEVNGLAFSFDYGNMAYGIDESSIQVETEGTWMERSELVVLKDEASDKVDIAFTGINPIEPPHNQPACKIIILEEFIGVKSLSININLINGVSLNSNGKATNFKNANYREDKLISNIDYNRSNSSTIFSVYTNSSDQLIVNFINPLINHTGQLMVHTINGELIMTNNTLFQSGRNTFQINTNNRSRKVYVISLSSAKLPKYSKKIMIR